MAYPIDEVFLCFKATSTLIKQQKLSQCAFLSHQDSSVKANTICVLGLVMHNRSYPFLNKLDKQ